MPDLSAARVVQRACDRCAQGVMDASNPHLLGTCSCACHSRGALVAVVERVRARINAEDQGGEYPQGNAALDAVLLEASDA